MIGGLGGSMESRNIVAYWLLGLLNNIAYVIMVRSTTNINRMILEKKNTMHRAGAPETLHIHIHTHAVPPADRVCAGYFPR